MSGKLLIYLKEKYLRNLERDNYCSSLILVALT